MKLNFPSYLFQIEVINGKKKIWDPFRKKFIVLTPEELVRQHLLQFLVQELKFPKNLISVEKALKVNTLSKRYDLVVFNQHANPILIGECKAPKVKLTQAVFEQIGRYNIALKVPYLLVSNGLEHYFCKLNFKDGSYNFLASIPNYSDL